jgi:serine/threonine protein kinase
MIGKTISHYKILEKLGEGGMGVVYKAEDTKLRRTVALKFLAPEVSRDPEAKKRFLHEAQAASSLEHPNICSIYEIDETPDGQLFIVMPCYEAESLQARVERGPIKYEEAVSVAIQVASGLSKAHKTGVIHRDVKPANILVTRDGLAKIVDFGIAKLSGCTKLTRTGATLGTMAYMSPEQLKGEDVDHRSDIWALGVVLYEMVTGETPFGGDYEQAVAYSIMNEKPRSVTDLQTGVPMELGQVVNVALAKIPSERYESAGAFLADLESLREDLKPRVSEESRIKKQRQPSIAVLPFVNLSAEKEQEYFCDGMSEEIINALTHIKGLHVVARTSAFAFKGQHADIREIGEQLNVETILEGSIRKAGKRLRITAQLVNIEDGYHLWSEKYDRDMDDVFAIQDEIGLAVAEKLKIELLKEEKTAILKRHTLDVEAYNDYLMGIYFLRMYTEDGFRKAIVHFDRALEKDPDFALVYYGLGELFNVSSYFGNMSPNEAYPRAREYLKKALEMDNTLGEAHAALSLVYAYYEWNWRLAEEELRQALKLNPNSSVVHLSHSWVLSLIQRHDEAIAEAKRAQELDPLSDIVNTHVGFACIWGSQYDKAIEELQTTLTMNRNFYLSHYYLGLAYRAKSMIEEAIAEFERAVEMGTGTPWPATILAATYFESGKRAKGDRLFEDLKKRARDEYVPPMGFVYIHLARGELDMAFDWLARACVQHDSFLPWCNIIPIDCYRIPDEPRFRELLTRAGLPQWSGRR